MTLPRPERGRKRAEETYGSAEEKYSATTHSSGTLIADKDDQHSKEIRQVQGDLHAAQVASQALLNEHDASHKAAMAVLKQDNINAEEVLACAVSKGDRSIASGDSDSSRSGQK